MAKIMVTFESKYGNTKLVAENVIEGIEEGEGIEAVLSELKKVDLDVMADYDVILIGSPNHFGGPTRSIRKFIDKLGKLQLNGKSYAVFDTYIKADCEKAVKKMEKRISEKASSLKRIVPGLSIKVQGMKGPILDGELIKCRDFGKEIAEQIRG